MRFHIIFKFKLALNQSIFKIEYNFKNQIVKKKHEIHT